MLSFFVIRESSRVAVRLRSLSTSSESGFGLGVRKLSCLRTSVVALLVSFLRASSRIVRSVVLHLFFLIETGDPAGAHRKLACA